ncbi:phosphotransferase family protein [Paenibacillus harenae]|uniref:phosphotransferase family protein n=1 Tax=Paenibacillus harenae TaxID=306543 RepID=UPI0003FBD867|nr:aminoglycoside phosphotransferase family protein [Paenibacillus harenae]
MQSIVTPEGQIDDKKILRRETIYKGMNGKLVERIYVTPYETFIYKPLIGNAAPDREVWIYEHILPSFPPIYPKMIARSPDSSTGGGWALFEDLGRLGHVFDEAAAKALLSQAAAWHALPTEPYGRAQLRGQKPASEVVRAEMLQLRQERQLLTADTPNMPDRLLNVFFSSLRQESLPADHVLSHGDLHLGNYALVDGQIKVLDWEDVHLNSRYWDLYYVIDLSHPLFPKAVQPAARERLLEHYMDEVARQNGAGLKASFKRHYYLFSALYSLWMLKLIQSDIANNNGTWPLERLKLQLQETTDSFIQCAEQL